MSHPFPPRYNGHDASFRQALVGGNYGLLTAATYEPRPDLYSSILWRQLFGDVVLEAAFEGVGGSGTQGDLRTYAACARPTPFLRLPAAPLPRGAVAVAVVNLGDAEVPLDLGDSEHETWLWLLTARDDASPTVALNGRPVAALEEAFPGLPPAVVANVSLPARSYAFLVLPAAARAACVAPPPREEASAS